jgi:hypothetical protein
VFLPVSVTLLRRQANASMYLVGFQHDSEADRIPCVAVCRHGFSCKYRHIAQDELKAGSLPRVTRSYTSTIKETIPLSLQPQLDLFEPANAASVTSDGCLCPHKWLTPAQVQEVLAECKRDNVDFRNPNLVYRFCEALLSANAKNPLWVSGY